MKNNLKVLAIVIAIIMMVGINVKAEELYSDGGMINITVPIHKTDSNKKGLEGAIFTLKDFNNTISYSSNDQKDGDYLIEIHKENRYESAARSDQESRIDDYTDEDSILTEILDVIPTKYSDVLRKAETKEDFSKILDLPVVDEGSSETYYSVGFYVPLKVEESKVPTGYKAKNIVIPAFVYLRIDTLSDQIYVYSDLVYTPGYTYNNPFEGVPAYFEYKDGTDYEKLFDEINTELKDFDSEENSMEKLVKIFEDNGAIIDKDCDYKPIPTGTPMPTPTPVFQREDFEERFDDEIEEFLCPINLVDEKEDIKVNPQTYGTFAIILVIAVAAGGFTIYRKTKKEA